MNNFNEIKHRPLRAFNRFVFASNILADEGRVALQEYLDQFSMIDKIEMGYVKQMIDKLGEKRTREIVTEGLVFKDDPYVGEEI